MSTNFNYPFAEKKLMTPGPVPVPDYVKEIFANFHMHHRRPEFADILQRSLGNLKKVFQTQQHCFALPSTGTGAMEAALINTLNSGDQVLVVDSGKFGERWGNLAKAFGLKADHHKIPWGNELDLGKISEKLNKNSYGALLIQACETSTGAAHPIADLGKLCQSTETLLIVDGITAVAAYDIPMDNWHIDVLIGGSQKGFMLPTGLAFISLSAKAWDKSKTSQFQKYYWDLTAELAANEKGRTRFSTPVQFFGALDKVLEEILVDVGLQNFFKRTSDRAQLFREKVNLPIFAKTPSPSLTCMEVPQGVSANAIRDKVFHEDGISIICGQDKMKDRFLRVGHMGAMTDQDLVDTAQAINKYLEQG